MRRILKNSVLCKKCNTEVISKYRHDFQTCNCGMCFCDGGGDYQRSGFLTNINNPDDMINTIIYDNGSHKLRKKYLLWGKNTDKNGKYLNKIEWIPIGKLTTDHIWNILLNEKNIDSLYKETMIEEIINREEELIKLWKLKD